MGRSETEDAGGLTPVKDDNEAAPHFYRRTLLFFNCFDYIYRKPVIPPNRGRAGILRTAWRRPPADG